MRPWGERAGLLAVLALAGVVLWRPVLGQPTRLALGSTHGEAPRHLWGLWGALLHRGDWGPFVAALQVDHPSGYLRHLMDPINLLFFAPGYALAGGGPAGAALGYNLVHLAWVGVAGLGGWLLARRLLGAHPQAALGALVAALACATAPYLLATPYLGRTELLPGVAYPLHLFFLWRALAPSGRWWDLLAAGLSLAAMALGGWYLAAWLLLFEPPLALVVAWCVRDPAAPWGRPVLRLAAVALLAVLPVLPALAALLAYPPPIMGEEQRLSVHMGINTPPQLLLPFLAKQGLPGVELPAYPGAVVLFLALGGLVVRWRQVAPWLVLAGAVLALSLGPYLVFTNDATALTADPMRLPAWYVEKFIPPIRFIWGWCRLGIWATWPLAMAAAWGAAALFQRFSAYRWQIFGMLAAVLVVDQAQDRAPAGVLGRAFDPAPPAELVTALQPLPPGAVVQLPFDDFYMVWQMALGRSLAESLEIEDVHQQSYLVQHALALLDAAHLSPFGTPAPGGAQRAQALLLEMLADPQVVSCLKADGPRLAAAGYAALVLHRDRLPDLHQSFTVLLETALGTPVYSSRDLAIWQPLAGPVPAGLLCPLEVVEVVVPGDQEN